MLFVRIESLCFFIFDMSPIFWKNLYLAIFAKKKVVINFHWKLYGMIIIIGFFSENLISGIIHVLNKLQGRMLLFNQIAGFFKLQYLKNKLGDCFDILSTVWHRWIQINISIFVVCGQAVVRHVWACSECSKKTKAISVERDKLSLFLSVFAFSQTSVNAQLIISFLLGMVRHVWVCLKFSLITNCQYPTKSWVIVLVFCKPAGILALKLQIDHVTLVEFYQACSTMPKGLWITNCQYFWSRLSNCLDSLQLVRPWSFRILIYAKFCQEFS